MDYYNNRHHPNETNDYETLNGSEFENRKSADRGYTFVYRKELRKNGQIKNTKIDIYTSGDLGSQIRDASSGNYYSEKVGTHAEHMFFKVGLSTGERKSKNGSTTLFFLSPKHYETHLLTELGDDVKNQWLEKKASYMTSRK